MAMVFYYLSNNNHRKQENSHCGAIMILLDQGGNRSTRRSQDNDAKKCILCMPIWKLRIYEAACYILKSTINLPFIQVY
jgi:hypothetical protein